MIAKIPQAPIPIKAKRVGPCLSPGSTNTVNASIFHHGLLGAAVSERTFKGAYQIVHYLRPLLGA